TLRVWDATTGAEVFSRAAEWVGNAVTYSPDGRLVAVGGRRGAARVFAAENGDLVVTLAGHRQWVTWVRFSPDGTRLAAADDDGRLKLWVAGRWQEVFAIQAHRGWVRAAEFSPDGNSLVTTGDDGFVRLWDGTPRSPVPPSGKQ